MLENIWTLSLSSGILLLGDLLTHLASKPLDDATIHSMLAFFTDRLVSLAFFFCSIIYPRFNCIYLQAVILTKMNPSIFSVYTMVVWILVSKLNKWYYTFVRQIGKLYAVHLLVAWHYWGGKVVVVWSLQMMQKQLPSLTYKTSRCSHWRSMTGR